MRSNQCSICMFTCETSANSAGMLTKTIAICRTYVVYTATPDFAKSCSCSHESTALKLFGKQYSAFLLGGLFFSKHLFYVFWRIGTKPMLTPHDGRLKLGLSGFRAYDHLHDSPKLYHCATGDDLWFNFGNT